MASTILDEVSSKAPPGTVLPPRNIRDIIEKTAGYVDRNGPSFADKIRTKEAGNTKFSFLASDDAYYAYYKWRLDEIGAGRGNIISAGREHEAGVTTGNSGTGREPRKGPTAPEEFQFSARMPNISASDLDVVRLTALFVAKNGRSWMSALAQREAGHFQFDFLRPQHSLYQFFSRLVDQYTDLITAGSVDEGRPEKKRIAELRQNVEDRFHVLERAKKRAEWTRHVEAQKVAKEEQDEKERISFAQIDWHDFTLLATVVFDEHDENEDYPPPTNLNDLQSASLEQKVAMTVDTSLRIEEAMPTYEDDDQFHAGQQEVHTPAPAVQQHMPPLASAQPTPPIPASPFHPPPQFDDEPSRVTTLQADRDRARAAQEAALKSASAPKIRTDYVPRAKAKQQAQNTSICPNCGQAIPNDEMTDHMRIELLDPQWREQAKINQQRSSTTNLSTNVANNLKRLASQRTDVFDPVTGRAVVPDDEAAKRKRMETDVPTAANGVGGGEKTTTQPSTDMQEQIRQIHQKYRG